MAGDDLITCERCGKQTYSWAAEACRWWPLGCGGPPWRVCGDCQTGEERYEVAQKGCSASGLSLGRALVLPPAGGGSGCIRCR